MNMIKKLLLLSTALLIFTGAKSQINQFPLKGTKSTENVKFAPKSSNSYQLKVSLDKLNWKAKKEKNGEVYTELWFDKSNAVGEVGTPQLPAYKKLILLPYGATATAKVKSYTQAEFAFSDLGVKNQLVPVQPSIRKDQDSSSVPFQFKKEAYLSKAYIQNSIVKLEVLGNMRSYTVARIVVTPVDYNPTLGSIKVYNDLDIEIDITGSTKSATDLKAISSPYFNILTKSALNTTETVYDQHPDLTKYPVKMLIISNRMFETSLAPFVAWKTQKGIKVTVAYTDVIGSTTAQIKSYIQQQYNAATAEDPAPTFLVFVGDVAQVPSSATGSQSLKQTDLYYASVDGDIFPEMYYGRMSATTTQQLDNIINKILYYERYEFADPQYLNNVTLIAGADATYNPAIGQPTIKYGTANYFNSSKGFTTVNEFGVSNDPNNTSESSGYTGCYDASKISVGFINYTAHCSETTWGDPELTISEINAFSNQAKYPLAVANCCFSGDFGTSECVGEAWIRAQDKGAVTYIGSSPSSYWKEDMYWSVGAFAMSGINSGYVPTFAETTTGAYDAAFVSNYRTTGALVFAGNLAVTEANNQSYPTDVTPTYYWEAYNILGDPSLMPYFTSADGNQVTHETTVPVGVSSLKVRALESSYVSINKGSEILGTSYFEQTGEVDVPITTVQEPCDLVLTVTRPQTIPYIDTVSAVVVSGPYVTLNSTSINDSQENNNGKIDFGETVKVNLVVKNVGLEPSTNTRVLLSNQDGLATLTSSDSVFIGTVQNGTVNNPITLNDAFTFDISSNVADNSTEKFTLTFKSDQGTWTSTLALKIYAPQISIGDFSIDDSVLGNNNQAANVGESFYGEIVIKNSGNSDAKDLIASVAIPDSLRDIVGLNYEPFDNIEIAAGGAYTLKFRINVNPDIAETKTIPVNVAVSSPSNSYVSAKADKSFDVVSDNAIVMKNQSITTCNAIFTDSGGASSNYSNSESFVTTITSASEIAKLKISFSEFSVESGYDYLYVYDGATTASSQVSGSPFSGTTVPADIVASGKSLTFKFTSDSEVTRPGWKATVSCVEPTSVPSCATNPNPSNGATNVLPSSLTWTGSSDAQFYDVYIGYSSDNLALLSRVTESSIAVNLERNKGYFWKVIPGNYIGICENTCDVWSFQTGTLGNTLMTNGSVAVDSTWFYDSGSSSSNYKDGEDYILTFTPKNAGTKLKVAFEQFSVESQTECNYDYLSIYDGATTSNTLVGKYCGSTLPSTHTSTSADGSLTFKFHSDGSQNLSGWKAKITSIGSVTLYNFTVSVKNNGTSVSGAAVTVDGVVKITAASGEVTYSLSAGNYNYTVNATGYLPVSGNATISGAGQTLNVDLTRIYGSTITVLDDATSEPIQGAMLTINGNNYYTNPSGVASISTEAGVQSVTIEKYGYTNVTSDINVVSDGGNFNFTLKQGLYNFTVNVKDTDGNPIESATVQAGNSSATTDASGTATMELPFGTQKFVVVKDRYLPAEQWVNVGNVSQVEIVLDTLLSELGNVKFTVIGQNSTDYLPLERATVSILFGDLVYNKLSTNSIGEASVTLPDANYKYIIEKSGYAPTDYKDFTINNTDYNFKDTLLQASYRITFSVSSKGSPIEGASIALSGYNSILTDSQGEAVFTCGNYTKGVAYSVQKDGYYNYTGTVDIDADKTVIVDLLSTGIEDVDADLPRIYPNPATDNITVVSVQPMMRVQVIGINGSLALQINANGLNSIIIPVSQITRGSYIVRVVSTTGKISHAKLIKI